MDVNANDVVAFVVEVAVIVLLAVAGFGADPAALGVLLGLALPGLAIALWGAFAAPRASHGSPPVRLAVKLLVLAAGVVAGFVVLPVLWATAFALVVAGNTLLMYVGPLARHDQSQTDTQPGG